MHTQHLNETILGEYLKVIYPDYEIIHDKIIPNSKCRFRPDYRIEELKLLVEFDGFSHFNSSATIVRDERKTAIFKSLGYKIINIPYFIQLDERMLLHYFGDAGKNAIPSEYHHGFISKVALLPADFCNLGIKRFHMILSLLPLEIDEEIITTLHSLVDNGRDPREVY